MDALWTIMLFGLMSLLKQAVAQELCGTLRWSTSCPTEQFLETIQVNLRSRLNEKIREATNEVSNLRIQREEIQINAENHDQIKKRLSGIEEMSQNITVAVEKVAAKNNESNTYTSELVSSIQKTEGTSISFAESCSKNSYRRLYSKVEKSVKLLTGKDCAEIHKKGGRKNGFYYIRPVGSKKLIRAYCDMKDSGGGWTVIQRRYNGRLNFDRDWDSYKWGFRQEEDTKQWEYWVGNEYIHLLTQQNVTEIKINLISWEGTERYVIYKHFSVANETYNYNLRYMNGYVADTSFDIGNAMKTGPKNRCRHSSTTSTISRGSRSGITHHERMDFTTKDRDNDRSEGNCADNGRGGWWFNNCLSANLNGLRKRPAEASNITDEDGDGILWTTWKSCDESLKGSTMKIRPSSFRPDETPILPPKWDTLLRQKNSGMKLTRRLSRRWRRGANRRKLPKSRRFK